MHDEHMGRVGLLVLVITYADIAEATDTIRRFEELLNGQAKGDRDKTRVVIWDNKSLALEHSGHVDYVSSPHGNIGFGAAVNAVRSRYDFDRILLLNPDIDIDAMLFREILRRISTLSAETIWAPKLVNADGSQQTQCDSLFMRTVSQEVLDMFGYPARHQRRKDALHYLRGAVFSISSVLLDFAGGFDEEFFLYGEEADLCFRLKNSSKLFFDDEISVVHHGSQGHKGKSPKALNYSLDARVRLHRRYNGRFAGVTVALAVRLLKIALRLKRALSVGRRAAATHAAGK